MATATKEPAADAAAPDIAALLAGMQEQIVQLVADNAALRAGQPSFRPMEGPDASIREQRIRNFQESPGGVLAGASVGEERQGARTVPTTTMGERIPDNAPISWRPRFATGAMVRINPDSAREGWPEGRTWRDVLTKQRVDGIGLVIKPVGLTKIGQWKYKVRVKGLSGPVGDGFYDYELLAA